MEAKNNNRENGRSTLETCWKKKYIFELSDEQNELYRD